METTILCNVPNCTHTTSSCINLYLKDSLQLPVIYNDCMYFFVNVKSYSEEDGKMLLDLETQIRKYDFNNMSTEDVAVIEGVNANDSGGCYLVGSDITLLQITAIPNMTNSEMLFQVIPEAETAYFLWIYLMAKLQNMGKFLMRKHYTTNILLPLILQLRI